MTAVASLVWPCVVITQWCPVVRSDAAGGSEGRILSGSGSGGGRWSEAPLAPSAHPLLSLTLTSGGAHAVPFVLSLVCRQEEGGGQGRAKLLLLALHPQCALSRRRLLLWLLSSHLLDEALGMQARSGLVEGGRSSRRAVEGGYDGSLISLNAVWLLCSVFFPNTHSEIYFTYYMAHSI